MSRRYSRRRHRRNDDDVIGCLTSMFTLPLLIAAAFIMSDDPGKKRAGWYIVVFMVSVIFLASLGVSVEVILIILFIVILLLVIGTMKSSQSSASDNNISVEVMNDKATEFENSEPVQIYNEKLVKETERKDKKEEKHDTTYRTPNDTIFDKNLVLLQTNGKLVNKKISKNYSETEFIVDHDKENVFQEQENVSEKTELFNGYYQSVDEAVQKNHVPVDYCKIMIEEIKHTNVKECPGIAWKDEERFYILPMYVNGPIYSWPLDLVNRIECVKINDVDSENTYLGLIGEPIGDEYESLMPEYFMGENGVDTECYEVSNCAVVTSASGKILKKLLGLNK